MKKLLLFSLLFLSSINLYSGCGCSVVSTPRSRPNTSRPAAVRPQTVKVSPLTTELHLLKQLLQSINVSNLNATHKKLLKLRLTNTVRLLK